MCWRRVPLWEPPPRQIMLKHLVPNALGPVIVSFTFSMSSAMILEASLSYLGIGIQASWRQFGVHDKQIDANLADLAASDRYSGHRVGHRDTLAINFLGDGLNDALNPRQSGK